MPPWWKHTQHRQFWTEYPTSKGLIGMDSIQPAECFFKGQEHKEKPHEIFVKFRVLKMPTALGLICKYIYIRIIIYQNIDVYESIVKINHSMRRYTCLHGHILHHAVPSSLTVSGVTVTGGALPSFVFSRSSMGLRSCKTNIAMEKSSIFMVFTQKRMDNLHGHTVSFRGGYFLGVFFDAKAVDQVPCSLIRPYPSKLQMVSHGKSMSFC